MFGPMLEKSNFILISRHVVANKPFYLFQFVGTQHIRKLSIIQSYNVIAYNRHANNLCGHETRNTVGTFVISKATTTTGIATTTTETTTAATTITTTTTSRPAATSPPVCADVAENCQDFGPIICFQNQTYAEANCRVYCNFCTREFVSVSLERCQLKRGITTQHHRK